MGGLRLVKRSEITVKGGGWVGGGGGGGGYFTRSKLWGMLLDLVNFANFSGPKKIIENF
jgi:hypothetical protein